MEPVTRLADQVGRLLEAHQRAVDELDQERRNSAEGQRLQRQLEERLAQALRRVHELEQERGTLRERLQSLPDPGSLEEARRRLQALLETLEI